ncbi:hypothetical protein [Sphaerisporangium dianthi]|uniref:Uncharacterized protein n=1 Tax=Sphaerisporangium dianthi TaxID=1436120 RepID=A0ABV9CW51_9ACTN
MVTMHPDPGTVMEIGRFVRPHLPSLLADQPEEAWSALDGEVADALRRSAAQDVWAALVRHPATAEWVVGFLREGVPPETTPATRGPGTWPGKGAVVAAPRFDCPEGDCSWFRRSPARPVPICRTHGLRLIPSAASSP